MNSSLTGILVILVAFVGCIAFDPEPVDLDEGERLTVQFNLNYSVIMNNTFTKATTNYYNVSSNNVTIPINFEFFTALEPKKALLYVVHSDAFNVRRFWYRFTAVGNITVTNAVDKTKTLTKPFRTSLEKWKPRSFPFFILTQPQILEEGWVDPETDLIAITLTLEKYNYKRDDE